MPPPPPVLKPLLQPLTLSAIIASPRLTLVLSQTLTLILVLSLTLKRSPLRSRCDASPVPLPRLLSVCLSPRPRLAILNVDPSRDGRFVLFEWRIFFLFKKEPGVEEFLRAYPFGETERRPQSERRGWGSGNRGVLFVAGDFPPRVHDPKL